MIPLPDDREQVFASLWTFGRRWNQLLAEGRSEEACSMLEPEPGGTAWSPEQIEQVVRDTFPAGSRFRREHPEGLVFSQPPATLPIENESVWAYNSGDIFWLEFDLFLNGERSDLTAIFTFRVRHGQLVPSLHDLHVL